MFYLVQRLTRKKPSTPHSATPPLPRPPFGSRFACEHMWVMQFEGPAIPEALQKMQRLELDVVPTEVTRDGLTRTVYLIVSRNPFTYRKNHAVDGRLITTLDEVVKRFQDWASQPRLETKGNIHFDIVFSCAELNDFSQVEAWWSLNDNLAWTLEEEVAQELLEAFMSPEIPSPLRVKEIHV